MAQLVVKRHADAAETGAAEPGAIEGGGASGEGMRVGCERGQGRGEGLGTFEGEEGYYRVRVAGVECFDFVDSISPELWYEV